MGARERSEEAYPAKEMEGSGVVERS